MKHILSLVKNKSYLKKFQTNTHLDTLKNILPDSIKQYLSHLYVKNQILFFVFNNPSLSMEFNHKKDFIKDLIKKIEHLHKVDLNIKDLMSIAPTALYKQKLKQTKKEPVIHAFTEQSTGEYKNNLLDKELSCKFENIRKIIKQSVGNDK